MKFPKSTFKPAVREKDKFPNDINTFGELFFTFSQRISYCFDFITLTMNPKVILIPDYFLSIKTLDTPVDS